MIPKRIFAENAEQEQWNLLLQFSYPSNIHKALIKNGASTILTDSNVESIAGSIAQAHEYFKAAEQSSLFISPILLYYGITNLFFGIISLKRKEVLTIKNHGMKLIIPDTPLAQLGDIIINTSGDENGAFTKYNKSINNNDNIIASRWELSEIFKSIPEIKNDLELCYEGQYSHCIPVQIINSHKDNLERIQKSEVPNLGNIDFNNMILDYSKCYLPPRATNEYIILRNKINSQDIGYYSLSGQKFIFLYHEKENAKVILPVITSMFVGLFALCSLSRYHPNIWYGFVQSDSTGEKGLVDKFLNVCKRYIPNILLNYYYDEQILFSNKQQGTIDGNTPYAEEDIINIIRNELKRF